mgnify:FL=1|jgi:hypothetical protein|tara:strand:+ start:83 stop:772 length:690 start_codon:yes stop_codon:yes gene_type:complete
MTIRSILAKIKRRLFEKVLGGGIVYFDHFSRSDIMRQSAEYLLTNKIEGDYLHFGVGSGGDFISSYKCFNKQLISCHYYLFDSFQGNPTPGDDFGGKYKKGAYTYSKENLLKQLKAEKISPSQYTITEGYFNKLSTEELKQSLPLEKAAIVVLDCDLYESTTSALKVVLPYLQPGALLLVGEYFNYGGDATRGMRKALQEFLDNPEIGFKFIDWKPYGVSGKALIIQTK